MLDEQICKPVKNKAPVGVASVIYSLPFVVQPLQNAFEAIVSSLEGLRIVE
jgi:ABC-type molybdate transport system permease subunit